MPKLSNVVRLISEKVAIDAIPSGGGLAAGVKFLSSKESIISGFRAANKWVKAAIIAVRLGGEPNPWKDSDDETIAGEILRRIEERKRAS